MSTARDELATAGNGVKRGGTAPGYNGAGHLEKVFKYRRYIAQIRDKIVSKAGHLPMAYGRRLTGQWSTC